MKKAPKGSDKKGLRRLIFPVPYILAVAGLIQNGVTPLNAIYQSVKVYGMGFSSTPPNLLIEIARWLGPLITAGSVFYLVTAVRRTVTNWWLGLSRDSVAVYGNDIEKDKFLKQLGQRGIDGRDKLLRAQRYILTWDEEKNLSFYEKHRTELRDRPVYLRCSSIPAQSVADPGLKLFCPEETAARLFWKQPDIYKLSAECGHRMKIVLLGFGKMGQEVLLRALQNNIFHPDQSIEYHIFGKSEGFPFIHTELTQISDPVIFHSEDWYESLALVEQAAMVLVLPQRGQTVLLEQLLLSTHREHIDVFACADFPVELLEGSARFRLFYWEEDSCRVENIFNDLTLERAKRVNLRYCHIYSQVPETEPEKERQWYALDSFTRYSNISTADYHEIRLLMLKAMGLPADISALTQEQQVFLSELEHIRWCRYHYLSNWRFGKPEDGKRKDGTQRLHADLVPFSDLPEGEWEKDLETIRTLFSVNA